MASGSEQLALTVIERLQDGGHVAYLAGGCVRDRLMGRVPKDFDVATSAVPEDVARLFPRSQLVGAAFGVVLVRGPDKAQVEVATFRADGDYSDGRRPDSVRFTDAREDARRRDFTCNGLFFEPLANGGAGQLHDFVGGQNDIEAKVLRAIGDPAARFAEDHLRMLRAVRFAGKLGFAVEPGTLAAMKAHAGQIQTVSKERVHDELALILEHPSRAAGAALLQETGLLKEIWPKRLYDRPDRGRTFSDLQGLPAQADFVQVLAALYRELATEPALAGAEVAQLLREALMLSNTETEDLAWFLDHLPTLLEWPSFSKARLKRLLADPRWHRLEVLFVSTFLSETPKQPFLARIAAMQREGAAPPPFVRGDTLIRLGAPPGREFKRWLDELYDRQLEGELKTEEQAIAAAQSLIAGRR